MSRHPAQVQIGTAVRAARWARGVTQDELSRVLGIDRSTLARYETGDRPIPAAILIECAAHLRLSVDALLGLKAIDKGTDGVRQIPDRTDLDIVIDTLCKYPHLVPMIRELLETMPEVQPKL